MNFFNCNNWKTVWCWFNEKSIEIRWELAFANSQKALLMNEVMRRHVGVEFLGNTWIVLPNSNKPDPHIIRLVCLSKHYLEYAMRLCFQLFGFGIKRSLIIRIINGVDEDRHLAISLFCVSFFFHFSRKIIKICNSYILIWLFFFVSSLSWLVLFTFHT